MRGTVRKCKEPVGNRVMNCERKCVREPVGTGRNRAEPGRALYGELSEGASKGLRRCVNNHVGTVGGTM